VKPQKVLSFIRVRKKGVIALIDGLEASIIYIAPFTAGLCEIFWNFLRATMLLFRQVFRDKRWVSWTGIVTRLSRGAKFITFDLAMLTSMTSFRNHLLFGNLGIPVAPFLINSLWYTDPNLSGIHSNELGR